jgi:AcrR family transcriptional regulator
VSAGRVNQKARTREAILAAAIEILREGRQPTVPEAADRARVSPATAYRYFASADDLTNEASAEVLSFAEMNDDIDLAIDAAGDDVHARMDALVHTLGRRMLTDPVPFRQQVKAAHERWFAQQKAGGEHAQLRAGRRTRFIGRVLAPLDGQLSTDDHTRLVAALVVAFGSEATISLTDVAHLDTDDALEVMVVTCGWILDGALADAGLPGRGAARRPSKPRPRSR